MQTKEENILKFFEKNEITPDSPALETDLHQLMKYGKNKHYWIKYISKATINEVMFPLRLKGVPKV